MQEGDIPSIIALAALLVLSGFFSGSETAIIGSERITLSNLAKNGSRSARLVLKLLDDPKTLLGTILVGNNLVNVAAAAVGAVLLGPIWATIIITIALLLIGEIPPKTLAAQWPDKISRIVAYPIAALTILFRPIVWITNMTTSLLLWPLTRGKSERKESYSEDELQTALAESQNAGELEPGEARMAQEILELDTIPITDIMIPVDDAAIVREDWDFERVLDKIHKSRFTRYPVYGDNPDKPVGMLHIKDLLVHANIAHWKRLVRPLPAKPDTIMADDLLREMQLARFHMAAIVNKTGEVVGFVTMESILEEIVGEIADEHDRELDPIRLIEEGTYSIRKDLEIADIARILNLDIDIEDAEQSISSLFVHSSHDYPTNEVRLGEDILIRNGKQGYVLHVINQPHESESEAEAMQEEEEVKANGNGGGILRMFKLG